MPRERAEKIVREHVRGVRPTLTHSEMVDDITAALREAGKGWQPDDLFILLYCPEDGSRWLAKGHGGRWYGVDDSGLTREGYSAGDPNVVTGWAVTLWQPLPEPPAIDKAEPK